MGRFTSHASLKIAQHFKAGSRRLKAFPVPAGRQNRSSVPPGLFFSRHPIPALKGWAIFLGTASPDARPACPLAPTPHPLAPTGLPFTPTGLPLAPTGRPWAPTEFPKGPTGRPEALRAARRGQRMVRWCQRMLRKSQRMTRWRGKIVGNGRFWGFWPFPAGSPPGGISRLTVCGKMRQSFPAWDWRTRLTLFIML